MKISRSLLAIVGCMFLSMSFVSCDPFGQDDPEAGNQTNPTRQVMGTYDFEYSSDKPEFSDLDSTGNVCEVVKDDSLSSNVLHLKDAGYARIINPFNSVKLQNGAGIAFWVKTDSMDLTRPLISFGYANADSATFYFTPNGQIVYRKPGQLTSLNLDDNDPSTYRTGMLSKGVWHYVALQLTKTGYQFYIDGKRSVSGSQSDKSSTSFQYTTLLDFVKSAPYIYIGTDTVGIKHHEVSYDDLLLVRNQMEESDWNKSKTGGPSSAVKLYIPVGSSDCSSAWWTAFSDYFTIPANSTFHTQFINHTSGANNWNNWNFVLSTDDDRGGSNYSEYFVLRSDLYGWGNSDYSASNISNSYGISSDAGWAAFRKNMEGALVDLTLTRTGATCTLTATATCSDGTVYTESYHQNCGDGKQNVRAFFAVDASYLQIDPEQTYVGSKYNSGSYLVGNADYSSAWWTAFSDCYNFSGNISSDNPFVFHFINNQTGKASNWNNWLLVCSTGGYSSSVPNKGGTAAEHFVLRADAYGWGDSSYDAKGITNSFNFDTFVSDMHGAECWMGISRSGSLLTMDAREKTASGKFLPSYTFTYNGASGTMGLFLTAELASLDILDVAYYPYFSKIGKTE